MSHAFNWTLRQSASETLLRLIAHWLAPTSSPVTLDARFVTWIASCDGGIQQDAENDSARARIRRYKSVMVKEVGR